MAAEIREFRTKMRLERVPVDALILDPNNYRFRGEKEAPERVPWKAIADEERQAMLLAKLLGESKELKRSILTTLGPIERPIVVPFVERGKFVVLEGNRRVACCKSLRQEAVSGNLPEDVPKDAFDSVEVLVLPEELNTENVRRVILGTRHISGILTWGPFERASIIKEYKEDEKLNAGEISSLIGLPVVDVNSLYRAYNAFLQFAEETGLWDPDFFSYFVEADRPKMREFLGMQDDGKCTSEDRHLFYDWIQSANGDAKIPRAIDIRKLIKVLDDDTAYEIFANTDADIDDAYQLVRGRRAVNWQPRISSAVTAITSIPHSELANLGAGDLELLQRLETALAELMKNLKRLRRE